MNYIEIDQSATGQKVFARVDDDGLTRFTCLESDPEYQAWLNPTTLAANPAPTAQ
jgi:hypothetical protein